MIKVVAIKSINDKSESFKNVDIIKSRYFKYVDIIKKVDTMKKKKNIKNSRNTVGIQKVKKDKKRKKIVLPDKNEKFQSLIENT